MFLKILTIIITACDNSTTFICTSGQCVSKHTECNGVNDCDDASDEISCGKYLLLYVYQP